MQARATGVETTKETLTFPPWVPAQAIEIGDKAAIDMLQTSRYSQLETNLPQPTFAIAHAISNSATENNTPALLFLHGFDSSSLDFRYIKQLIEEQSDVEAHFIDILGWGLTDKPNVPGFSYGPSAKREQVRAYHDQFMDSKPMVIIGASIGGAVAIDFALKYPERTKALVLLDAQAFTDKRESKLMQMFPIFASWGAELLRSNWLRWKATEMAYESESLRCEDTVRIGALHCKTEGWKEATVNFIQGEGYCIKDQVQNVACPTLVLWGDNDRILPRDNAQKFVNTIHDCRLEIVKECGHNPHIEKPSFVLRKILDFVLGLPYEN